MDSRLPLGFVASFCHNIEPKLLWHLELVLYAAVEPELLSIVPFELLFELFVSPKSLSKLVDLALPLLFIGYFLDLVPQDDPVESMEPHRPFHTAWTEQVPVSDFGAELKPVVPVLSLCLQLLFGQAAVKIVTFNPDDLVIGHYRCLFVLVRSYVTDLEELLLVVCYHEPQKYPIDLTKD